MQTTNKRTITAEDLYDIQIINDLQISPDGETVVFSLQRVEKKSEKKFSNLWIVPTTLGDAQQFTQGDQSDRQPRWSPDGQQIAFLSNRKDEKQTQLYIIPFRGGEARPLTDLKGSFGRFQWSPDGTRIVCVFRKKDEDVIARENDEDKKRLGVVARHITRLDYKADGAGFIPEERWHLWIIDAVSGEATQLTDSDLHDELGPVWSPDGQQIVFLSNRADNPDLDWDMQDVYIIPASGGKMRKLNTHSGIKAELAFSPDGAFISYLSSRDKREFWRPSEVYLTAIDGSSPPLSLTAAYDFDASNSTINDSVGTPLTPPTWSADSTHIYFQVSHHGHTLLKSVSVADQQISDVIGPKGTVGLFSLDQAGEKIAYLHTAIDNPGQIWLHSTVSGKARHLTSINEELFSQLDLGNIEEVWYKGKADNDLQGWILTPPGFDPAQKYPAILEIHGGPMAQYGYAFMHEFYYLAAQGYVVFYTNPRGGLGYGAEHTKSIYNDWGSADYADVMAWVDLVEQKPYIDKTRIGVTGGSYGGFMTNWIISHTDRFKAAVTQRSLVNFISMFGSSDLHTRWQALFGAMGPPWEDWDNYWQQSPLKYFANVKTPTLVIHSEQDLRCDIEQGEQVFTALKVLGVDTELVRFPEEAHGLSRGGRTDRRIVRLGHIVRWFDKYLK